MTNVFDLMALIIGYWFMATAGLCFTAVGIWHFQSWREKRRKGHIR